MRKKRENFKTLTLDLQNYIYEEILRRSKAEGKSVTLVIREACAQQLDLNSISK